MASNVLNKRTKRKGGYYDGLDSPITSIIAGQVQEIIDYLPRSLELNNCTPKEFTTLKKHP